MEHGIYLFKKQNTTVQYIIVMSNILSYQMSLRVLWCVVIPLRFPQKHDVRFVFTYRCVYDGSCLIYVTCVCLRIVVSNTYCVEFFALFIFVLCLMCPMLPVSLDCPFLIVPLVSSNVYLSMIKLHTYNPWLPWIIN